MLRPVAPNLAARAVITCEHGGNRIPAQFATCFSAAAAASALASHRGHDAGAADLARALAARAGTMPMIATISRLLVDLNRSVGHRHLFSEFTRDLPASVRAQVLDAHYFPHRRQIIAHIDALIDAGHLVVHVAAHSFTPVLDGVVRTADVGLLFDPCRIAEAGIARDWRSNLKAQDRALRVRRNYPYRGNTDGLTTALRKRYPARHYAGIELEINQALLDDAWPALCAVLAETFANVLTRLPDQEPIAADGLLQHPVDR